MKHNSQQHNPAGIWQEQDRPGTPRSEVTSGWAPTGARIFSRGGSEHRCNAEVIHALVEKQAEMRSHAIALCDERVRWSYGEVEGRANQLAHVLRSRGVRPGTLVGMFLPRSAEAIVAILGILKAGGAYVPIDPDYPREWLATILRDSQIELLVTSRELASQWASGAVQPIYLDAIGEYLTESSTERFDSDVRPSDPAYVIYTSGSTGEPKGTVVEHRNIVYSTRCRLGYYSKPVGRFALIPSLSFDSSVATIFWTLSQGGTLCLPPPGLERDPARLSQWIAAEQISHWLSVPVLYQLLLAQPTTRLQSLKVVVLGGESCPAALVHAHHATLTGADLYNEYGPTEATVWSSVHECRSGQTDEVVPIGRPLPGTRMLVLDERGQPVAIGEPGELYIGGPGVARSYLRKSQLTLERFVADHLSGRPGERLYRTGDRAKQLLDGSFQFLGRLDSQVKIRGHRVELGQVEAAFDALDDVAQAVVVTRHCGGHDQLIAFVVPRGGTPPAVSGLRLSLREQLPSYMVPSHIVLRDHLPLTVRGKIDRQALQTAELDLPSRSREIALPADEIESRLIACWEDIFGRKPIGASEDFFELGGDSLLAAGLFAKIEAMFGRTLPPETLLERPTVRLLAKELRGASPRRGDNSPVRIYAGVQQPPLFCLPGIGGHVLQFRGLAEQLHVRHAVYGLRPEGLEDQHEPQGSIEAMAAHAVEQMRRVQPHGPYALVGYSLGGVVAFEMSRQLKAAGQEIALLALLDSRLWSPSKPLDMCQRLRLHGLNLLHSTGRGRWNYFCERCRLLTARLRRLSFRPSEDDVVLGLGLSAASQRVARQHWRAWRDYQPGNYDGDLTLFVARRHPGMPDENGRDPTLGWSQITTGVVDVTLMNATHAEMLRPKSTKVLAIAIESRLTRAARRRSHTTTI